MIVVFIYGLLAREEELTTISLPFLSAAPVPHSDCQDAEGAGRKGAPICRLWVCSWERMPPLTYSLRPPPPSRSGNVTSRFFGPMVEATTPRQQFPLFPLYYPCVPTTPWRAFLGKLLQFSPPSPRAMCEK